MKVSMLKEGSLCRPRPSSMTASQVHFTKKHSKIAEEGRQQKTC